MSKFNLAALFFCFAFGALGGLFRLRVPTPCNASLFDAPYTKRPVFLTIGMYQFETAFIITPCLYYIRRRGTRTRMTA